MTVFMEKEYDLELPFDKRQVIESVVNEAVSYVDCPYEVEVCVTLTDNEGIRELNAQQRDIDKATDVLSFPMIEYDTPGDFSGIEDDISNFNPETGELILGDIVISLDKVVSQAEEYNHSTKREFAFLVAHSMLHLFGYDHMEEDERIEMEQKQEEILKNINITREDS
ncbi:MAG: rRNA maturation RNase YbeY [Lachnospiraceae bacterium]|nr:rRNA maturation RNase YbeY [Lachnospiraceae bacterium]